MYLDAAATAPLRPEARAAMERVWDAGQANASSLHAAGAAARRELEYARETVAATFGVAPEGVVFTSGGTESNNLGVLGLALAHPRGRRIVTTRIEHSAVAQSVAYLERMHGFAVDYADVDATGRVEMGDLAPETTLVAMGAANSDIGTVQDVAAVVERAHAVGALVHLDAVQAAVALPFSLAADGWPGPGPDAVALASHKFGGPQGVGALLLQRAVELEPLLHGGAQEGGRRAGTENVAGIAGFAAAVAAHRRDVAQRAVALMDSRDALIAAVLERVPSARLTGHREERLPGHASFVVDGVSGDALLVALDAAGVAASAGSACGRGTSPVLTALGLNGEEALRFSLLRPLEEREIALITGVMAREVARYAGS